MTTRVAYLGGTSWVDGEVLTAVDLNDTFSYLGPSSKLINSIYTGTDFNSSNNNNSGTAVDDGVHIITLPTTDLIGANNVYLVVNYSASASGGNGANGYPTLKIEHSTSGAGSYSALLNETTLCNSTDSAAGVGDTNTSVGNLNLALTLSAGEKASGVDIKFTSKSYADQGGDSATSSFTNIQTYFKASK